MFDEEAPRSGSDVVKTCGGWTPEFVAGDADEPEGGVYGTGFDGGIGRWGIWGWSGFGRHSGS